MPLSRPALAPRGGRGGLRSLGNRLIVLCVVAVVALSLSVSALTAASDVPSATGTAEPPRYSDAAFVRAQLRRLVATPHNDYGAITNAGKNNNIGSAATETADAAAPVSLRQAAAASMAETHARLEPLLRLFTPSLNAPTAAHSNRGRKRSIDSEAESEPEPAAAVGEVWSRARDWLLGTITVPPEVSRVVAALVPAPLLAALSQPRQSSVTVGSGTEGESESESARAVGVVSEWLRQQWLHLNGAPDTEPDTQASTMSSSNNDGNGEAEAARAVRFLLQSTVDGTTASGDLDSIALALKSVSGDVSASSGLSTSRHIDPLAHLVFPDSDIDGDVEESHHAPATAARAQAAPALHRRPKLSSKASAVDHLTAKRSRSSSKDGDALGGQGYFSPKGHLPKGYLHHVDVSRLKAVSKSVTTAPAVFYSRPARAARATGAAGAAGFAALAGADAEPDSEFDFVEFPAVEATVVYPGARAWSAGEAFPCNQGRLTTATKQEWQNNGTVVDQAAAEAVLATPARANNYLDDVSTSEGFAVPACTQVSFFANETWLGNYLPTILSPEQIAELEGKPRLDFMQAVCAVVDARSPPDSTTVTTTNRAATLSVTDRDMCTRWRQCSAHALIAHYNYETSVCLCPYDAGGLLCANPRRTHCSAPLVAPAPAALECDIAAPASAHWPASFGNNYDAELFGPKPCHRFYPVSAQPADVPLAPGLSPADAGAARGTLRLTSRPQCAFGASADDTTTVTPIQGVSQYVQRVLALDGYTWDTAYNFTYYAFRPADNSSEASEARRDDPDAVAPLFAISARRDPVTGVRRIEKTSNTFTAYFVILFSIINILHVIWQICHISFFQIGVIRLTHIFPLFYLVLSSSAPLDPGPYTARGGLRLHGKGAGHEPHHVTGRLGLRGAHAGHALGPRPRRGARGRSLPH